MAKIILKDVVDEDFVNYKLPSMSLIFPYCTFKCGKENCQNYGLISEDNYELDVDSLCVRYINNPITEAIVCHGLEPFDSFEELVEFIKTLRNVYHCDDMIIIYTGYNSDEIQPQIHELLSYKNIIVKYGRYVVGENKHFDQRLGVYLASDNQYSEKIS